MFLQPSSTACRGALHCSTVPPLNSFTAATSWDLGALRRLKTGQKAQKDDTALFSQECTRVHHNTFLFHDTHVQLTQIHDSSVPVTHNRREHNERQYSERTKMNLEDIITCRRGAIRMHLQNSTVHEATTTTLRFIQTQLIERMANEPQRRRSSSESVLPSPVDDAVPR